MRTAFLLLPLLSPALPLPAQVPDPAAVDADLDRLEELYRHFHRHPELSFREAKTSARLAEELRQAGAEVTERVGGYGVVAVIDNGEGPTVMVRADMDALPVAEETGLPYASEVTGQSADGRPIGIMHACGHDVHMTVLVGTARYLASHRDQWSGRVVLIGQPAEERVGGAQAMLKDGLFDRFGKPDCALALHVSPDLPVGTVGYRAGYAMANVDSVDITVFGRGGHGSAPHTTVDPIVQAAELVLALQTIVSREVDPTEPAVVTVGSIHGGSKHNIISDSCHLQLTVRSYSDEVRALVKEAIVRKARAVAQGMRAPEPVVEFSESNPSLYNDDDLVARTVAAFRKTLGEDRVVEVPAAMVAEDFSRFGRAGVPIFMFRLGTIAPDRLARMRSGEIPAMSLHSGRYHPEPRPSLRTGVLAMVTAVLANAPPR